MTMPISTLVASNSIDRATFENFYAGKAPWDIGKPQGTFAAVADRVIGPVLDAGCGTGEHALFYAARGHRVTGIDFVEAALGGLVLGPPDRLFHKVDTDDPVAPGGEEQGVFARAAAGVQDRAGHPVGDRGEPPLRLADVPGGRPGVEVLKGGTVYRVARYQVALGHGHDYLLWLLG